MLPLLILIVLGIMEFGLLFTSYSTTTASSRSGARLAATDYAQAGTVPTSQLASAQGIADATAADLKVLNNATPIGMAVYRVNPSSTSGAPYGGFPGDGMVGGCTLDCIRFSWNPNTESMVYQSGSWPNPDACGLSVDSVGVVVQTRHDYITGAFGTQRFVDGHTVMRLEPLPTDQCSA